MTAAAGRPGPLAATLARGQERVGWLRLAGPGTPGLGLAADPTAGAGEPGDGWVVCGDLLADPARLSAWVDRVQAGLERAEGGPVPREVPATYLLGWYLDAPARVAAVAWAVDRRVPDLDPGTVALHLAPGGWPDGVALLSPGFTCLPADPAAGSPDARVVPDEDTLAAQLRDRFVAHAAAFLATYDPGVRIGSRQRWGNVTDALDRALCDAAGPRGAHAVLGAVHPPLTSASTVRVLPDGGVLRRRQSCCFWYRLPSGQECTTCPRVLPADW